MTFPAGSRLSPYEILAPIGVGRTGELYLTRDKTLGRDVAVKVLSDSVVAQMVLKWNHFAPFLRDLEALRAA